MSDLVDARGAVVPSSRFEPGTVVDLFRRSGDRFVEGEEPVAVQVADGSGRVVFVGLRPGDPFWVAAGADRSACTAKVNQDEARLDAVAEADAVRAWAEAASSAERAYAAEKAARREQERLREQADRDVVRLRGELDAVASVGVVGLLRLRAKLREKGHGHGRG